MYTPKQEKLFYNTSKKWLSSSAKVLEISELKDLLRYHEWKYYVRNSPTLADYEYDQLYKQLEAIEAANPNLITQDSPTQRVADDLSGNLDPVAHVVPMLSLANSYNAEDLASFDKSIKRYLNIPEDKNIEYSVEPKFDGGSIAVLYENDFLIRAATRGNGTMGEEMTANARTMPSIPLRAPLAELGIYKAEMRVEALIRKDNFAKINAQRETDGHALFANPRNAATGGLRTKDPNETRNRELEAFIFQLAYAVDKNGNDKLQELNTHYESIELMGQLGFKIPQNEMKTCVNIKELADYCATWEDKREKYEYEVDGLVVKVNDLKLQERSGSTQHHPRWAIAYKFKAKQATSILTDIEYQVGKIGSITPVAKIEPVQLAGVTVSSVSLHNEDFIKTKDLRIGDTILVERAGDVIPYIVKSMEELRDGSQVPVEYPTVCPINPDTDNPVTLVKEEGESAWRCLKCTCCQQDLQLMIFHVSKNAMDIDGFGKSYVENFHSHGWLKDISDVYNLDYNAIKTLEGFGSKSAEKLLSAVNKAKGNPIHRLLHSLSIHHLGKKASKLIAAEINHVFDLQYWNKEKFTSIKDIGPVVADNVIAYFSDPDHIAMLHRIEEHGVNMKQTKEDRPLVV